MFRRTVTYALVVFGSLAVVSGKPLPGSAVSNTSKYPQVSNSATSVANQTTQPKFLSKGRKRTLASRTLPNILGLLPNLQAQVDICLDLSINVLGITTINLAAVSSLGATIRHNGISVEQLAIIQANVASQLQAAAKTATTSWACQAACTADTCNSYSFNSIARTCILRPQQLTATSSVLAKIVADLSLLGSSSPHYCSLCSSRCSSTPTALAKLQKRTQTPRGLCPVGLDACPISQFSSTKGYECIDTREELESCGGCATTGEGTNCNTVLGVKAAGCSAGKCVAFSCEEGFQLTPARTCRRQTI